MFDSAACRKWESMGASFWTCVGEARRESWQRLQGELKVRRVTDGERELVLSLLTAVLMPASGMCFRDLRFHLSLLKLTLRIR